MAYHTCPETDFFYSKHNFDEKYRLNCFEFLKVFVDCINDSLDL